MMKYMLLLCLVLPFCSLASGLDNLRDQFPNAVSDSEVCSRLISELSGDRAISATERAYLGALQTVWANHVSNPIQKWKSFQKGRDNLEKAVKQSTNNAEIRLLRYSVQRNCPKFLRYHENLERDKSFLIQRRTDLTHPHLVDLLNSLISA